MNQPEITAIIPTFRRPDLLQRAIASVRGQSYGNIKIYVYDNASGDSTPEVVASQMRDDPRISYILRDSNIGCVNNMRDAILRATSPLYSIVNDDDFIFPDLYQKAVDAFERYPSACLACAPTVVIYVEKFKWRVLNQGWSPGFYAASTENAARMFRSHFVQTGVVLRTEVRDLLGPFECSGDDRLQMTLSAAAFPFVVLDSVGAAFTLHRHTYSALVGLRGGDEKEVFEALSSTSERILNLPISEVAKGYLLLVATGVYGDSFRARLGKAAFGKRCIEAGSEESLIPSVNWKQSAIVDVLERVPTPMKGIATKLMGKLVSLGDALAVRRSRREWNDLPHEVSSQISRMDVENIPRSIAKLAASRH